MAPPLSLRPTAGAYQPPPAAWWARGNVVSIIAISVAALILVRSAMSINFEWQHFQLDANREVEGLARELQAQVVLGIEAADQTLGAQVALIVAARSAATDVATLREAIDPSWSASRAVRGLWLVDGQGRVLSSSLSGALPAQTGRVIDLAGMVLPAPGHDGRFGSQATGRSLVGLLPPAASSAKAEAGGAVLPLIRAAYENGKPRRFLVAALNAEQMGLDVLSRLDRPGLNAVLLQPDGEPIASTAGLAAPGTAPRPYTEVLAARRVQGQLKDSGLRGGPVFAAARAVPGFPLAVAVEQDRNAAIADRLKDRLVARGLNDLVALLVLGAAWLVLRRQGVARDVMADAMIANAGKLEQSEQAMGLMLGSIRELVFRADALGRITFVNRSWEVSTGQQMADVLGQHLADLVEPEDRTRVEALFRPAPETLADTVLVRLRGRQELLSLELSVTPLGSGLRSDAGFVGIGFDLTQRQNVRERLQDRLDFAMRLLDVSPTAMFAKDTEGRFIEVNRAFLEIDGLSLQQVLGKTAASVFRDDDGRQAAADEHVLSTGETVSYERQSVRPDGGVCIRRITKSRLTNGNGKTVGIVGSSVDVTLYRQAEQAIREARDASLKSTKAKLEFERGFLSMAAHELRTPLTGLRLQAELLADAQHAAERRQLSQGVLASVDRIGHVLEQLMILSRVDGLRYTPLDMVSVDLEATYFKVMAQLQEAAAERGLRLRSKLRGCHVTGIEFGIYTLMRNLLHNAILYTPPGGQVAIEGRTVNGAPVLTVDDSGPGIPAAQREQAFARFNRLGQQQVKGSGLGLSIVRTIVALHAATVRMDRSPLGGLRVVVEFPAVAPLVPQFLDSSLMPFADTQPSLL